MKKYLLHRLLPLMIAYGGKYLMRALLWTCKIQTRGVSTFLEHAKTHRSLLTLWHSRIPIVSEFLNKTCPTLYFTAFISKSRDGEAASLLTESYDRGKVVRVPHNDKKLALAHMIEDLKKNKYIGVITPDGPRGPRNLAKPGVLIASQEADAKVVPFSWSATSFWQLKSWDKMLFPKPFSTIAVSFGEPFFPKDLSHLQEILLAHDQMTCQMLSSIPSDWPK